MLTSPVLHGAAAALCLSSVRLCVRACRARSEAFSDPAWRPLLHRRQKKGTTFLSWLNLLICNAIWQNLVLLLLMNIIVDVTYLISRISTNFHTFLCKKCDIGCYVINHGVFRSRSCCNFCIKIKGYSAIARRLVKEFMLKSWNIGGLNKLLKKIDDIDSDIKHFVFTSQVMKLMTTPWLMICHQFLSTIKKDAHKINWVPFSCLTV